MFNNNYRRGNNGLNGFLGPFILGGITGGLVAPYFYRPYYQPYPYYQMPYYSYPRW